jgi:hypothetical protein
VEGRYGDRYCTVFFFGNNNAEYIFEVYSVVTDLALQNRSEATRKKTKQKGGVQVSREIDIEALVDC